MSGQIDKMSDQNEDLKGHVACWRRKIISSPVGENKVGVSLVSTTEK